MTTEGDEALSPAIAGRHGARRRSRRGEGEALREEILAAAVALLLETESEEAVSIRAVAERVGVSPPSIYLHFADKEALLEAACLEAFAEFDSRLLDAASSDDPLAALQAIGRAYVAFALERPEHYRFMFMRRPPAGISEPTSAELETVGGLSLVITNVQKAQQRGLIDPGKDPMLVSYALWSAVHGWAALLIAKPHFPWGDREAVLDAVIEMAMHGVASSA